MAKQRKYGLEPKKENQGNYLRHLGKYVRVTFPGSTFYGKMILTNYDITLLSPTLNIVSHPYDQKKLLLLKKQMSQQL